jgi:hypothetical protein
MHWPLIPRVEREDLQRSSSCGRPLETTSVVSITTRGPQRAHRNKLNDEKAPLAETPGVEYTACPMFVVPSAVNADAPPVLFRVCVV